MSVWFSCRGFNCPCGGKTDEWLWGYCRMCWYTVVGGDQAQDFDLMLPPLAWLGKSSTEALS